MSHAIRAAKDRASAGLAAAAAALPRDRSFRVLRVSQVDATELDTQLTSMLRLSLRQILDVIAPSINDHYEPEMTLAMQLAMFLLAMWPNGTTYGLQLMSLKYRDERRSTVTKDAPVTAVQKVLWALLHFAVPYAIVRVNRWLLTGREQEEDDGQDEWKLRMWNNLQRLETAYSALSLVNFLVFLIDGRYRSVVDRVLLMRLVYTRRNMSRAISYEFQNRQIVWQGFTEFLLFVMPLVNMQSVRGAVAKQVAMWTSAATRLVGGGDAAVSPASSLAQPQLASDTCGICSLSPIGLPHSAPLCGHSFCYTCIQPLLLARPGSAVPCPVCGEAIDRVLRL